MKYATLEHALRSIWDYDDFIIGIQDMYLEDDYDKQFFKEYTELNPNVTSDELIAMAMELENAKSK